MEIPEFTYHRPETLTEACKLGRIHGDTVRYLAGGTELLVDLKEGFDSAGHLISLGGIPNIEHIVIDDQFLRIGAMSTLEDIATSEEVIQVFPALREAVLAIGSVQIRTRGTIGGNFCGAVPCADTPPVCICGESELKIVSEDSERTIPAEEFFLSPRRSVLEPGELLVEISIPLQPANSGVSYKRFSLRHGSSLAVASSAARIVLDGTQISDARVVLGAVAPVPLLAVDCMGFLGGESPSEDIFRQASKTAASEAKPITDIRGSEDFRRDLVEVLTFRALLDAATRAKGAQA